MGSSYIAIREEDYVQSANTLFHFMKKEDYLKSILFNKAIIPRYCVENINYLGIKNETTQILLTFASEAKCELYGQTISFFTANLLVNAVIKAVRGERRWKCSIMV